MSAPAGGRPWVISIHGIETRGEWQNELNSRLQRCGFDHELLDYGQFPFWKLLVPGARRRKVEWFRDQYDRVCEGHGSLPSLVAHSFGTYIACMAIRRYSL